ncbi:tripartite tricarboxylate transporter substrate binding protein [Leptolyngbya sp. 15MV]|nr:tripartite tricarboxylate transporter substrate binding protein [Leptolyngbya sp. 15MV]
MVTTRRALALAALAAPLAARAQDTWPNRPIRLIVPFLPGSAPDINGRQLADAIGQRIGQTLVIENRPGAGGNIGFTYVARQAPPDGYTLLFVPALVASVLPVTQAQSGLRVDSFVPICQVFSNSMALVVKPDSPIRSLRDLQAAAQARPGRMTYGTLGVTSIPHLAMVQWLQAAQAEIEHVPFRADAPVMTEVMTGRIDVGSIVLGSAAGRNDIRVLAVFDRQRHPDFPDAPTAVEQGFDVAPASFGGLFAPAGTPADRIARIEAACATAANSEAYRTAARTGSQPANYYLNRTDFSRRLAEDIEAKAAVLRTIQLN